MRKIAAVLLATSLLSANAYAETASLTPGRPAGVKTAQLGGVVWIWIAGLGLVAVSLSSVLANNGNNGVTTTATTSTAGAP